MARILYFVHGRGRGHASRARPIVRALREAGHEVHLSAGRDALGLLGELGGVTPVQSIFPGLWPVRHVAPRVLRDRRQMRSFAPQLVVSDGDMPALVAAWSLGLTTLAIGHDIVFTRCALPLGLDARRVKAQSRRAGFATRARFGVAVHFLPIEVSAANTIAAYPHLEAVFDDVRDAGTARGSDDRPTIVAYFRDQNGQRALEAAVTAGWRVRAFGSAPAGAHHPDIEWCPFERNAFVRALVHCDAVVASSGSNLLAECVQLRKPMLALHGVRDNEQALNAALIEAAGVGVACSFEALTSAVIDDFLRRVAAVDFATVDLAAEMVDSVTATLRTVERAL